MPANSAANDTWYKGSISAADVACAHLAFIIEAVAVMSEVHISNIRPTLRLRVILSFQMKMTGKKTKARSAIIKIAVFKKEGGKRQHV